jgi:hypothetical protein
MFAFLKRATPAVEVGKALWVTVRDGSTTRELAASLSEENSVSREAAFDEAVYFLSFATDLAIHTVFESDARRENALREAFLDHLRGYGIERHCPPCPAGDWVGDSNIWEIHSPGRDDGNVLQHLSDRFDLYAAAMRRPPHRSLPVVGVFCAFCDTLAISFVMLATSFFIDFSRHTQDFLRSIRIESSKA